MDNLEEKNNTNAETSNNIDEINKNINDTYNINIEEDNKINIVSADDLVNEEDIKGLEKNDGTVALNPEIKVSGTATEEDILEEEKEIKADEPELLDEHIIRKDVRVASTMDKKRMIFMIIFFFIIIVFIFLMPTIFKSM